MLLQMGDWLRVNGEASTARGRSLSSAKDQPRAVADSTEKNSDIQAYTAQDIRFTTSKSGSTLYATALGWPSGGSLTLHTLYSGNPYLSGPVCGVTLLGTGQSIAFEERTDGLHLTLPSTAPPGPAGDIAYVFVIPKACQVTAPVRWSGFQLASMHQPPYQECFVGPAHGSHLAVQPYWPALLCPMPIPRLVLLCPREGRMSCSTRSTSPA